ncbi:phenylalanyl-tRNA synthetase beta subunit [Vibrio ponticus]|uniref:DM13 domain-containing protein n=1 Tax=Vibrio rhodolitus TaxID=2231649 RepID=UPI000506319B|nr:DM13 domain-containing protein [Vibrio rhodolitus]GAK84260.1 phenylalanyl-tRNA synthetase beta subunit [Vibrio ponticus]
MRILLLIGSHLVVAFMGFALGIYTLPILTQPASPALEEIQGISQHALFNAEFQRERIDSDFLHWGEGSVSISDTQIVFMGELAPGPDYKLYLSPVFIETETAFAQYKDTMIQIGDVKTFDRFSLNLPAGVNVSEYNTVIVWCESFGEFITSARYN